MPTQNKFNIVIYGAGAIGQTLAVWLTNNGNSVSLLARPEKAQQLRQQSIGIKEGGNMVSENTQLKIIDHLDPSEPIDCLIITVKNFNLERVCQDITQVIDRETLILGLQNGVVNQQILPRYFTNVIYAIINYNAWQADPEQNTASVNWQVNINGPIILGTPSNQLQQETQHLAALFSNFISCQTSQQFKDDAHAKLVANLGNAVTTIIGNSHHQQSALIPLQRVFTQLTYEAVKTLKAAGFSETQTSLLPSWALINVSVFIPRILTRSIFRKKLALIGSTSMASDILTKGDGVSELGSINGYLVDLAEQHQVQANYSKRLYQLCQQRFSQRPFVPITAQQLCDYLAGKPSKQLQGLPERPLGHI